MSTTWIAEEMKTAELGDRRLNARLTEVLSLLAAQPRASIPAACGGRAEMVAAYRFFENENTSFHKVLQPHIEETRQRIAAQPVVIFSQDTSEIEVTRPERQVAGAGPLDGGPRRGAFLHLVHAFTPDGTPLGTVCADVWTREDGPPKCASLSRAQRAAMPIEEKESFRWVTGLQQAREEASRCPQTQVICVADSESDIYEALREALAQPAAIDFIVRASQNRAVLAENGENKPETLLREHLLAQGELFRDRVQVRGRKSLVACEKRARQQSRESRAAEVVVRAGAVTLRPPHRPDRKLPPLKIHAVLVSEVDPPADEPPVEWLLLTSLPINNIETVRQVIEYYRTRWMIEVLFRVLKSGCRVEERRFEYMDRLLTCLGLYLIVAWRTLYVCRLGRSCPELSCEVIFEPAEWQSVWKVVRREDPPAEPPALGEFTRLVAQLGGYINRKRAAPPGPQTLWIGLQRTHDIANCWLTFGPGAKYDP